MERLRNLNAGEMITESWLAELVREVRRNRPVAGPGLSARVTPGGTVLRAGTGVGGAGGGAVTAARSIGAWEIIRWTPSSHALKLGNCCYRRSTGFKLLDDMTVTLPAGQRTVCADVTLADGGCALRTYSDPEDAGGDYESGTAHIPLYTVSVESDGDGGAALTVLHDWRGAPELLQYV